MTTWEAAGHVARAVTYSSVYGAAERIVQIPRDGLQNQQRLEGPAFEVVLSAALQLRGNRTQDHEVPPNRRAKLTVMPDEPSTPQICDRPCAPRRNDKIDRATAAL